LSQIIVTVYSKYISLPPNRLSEVKMARTSNLYTLQDSNLEILDKFSDENKSSIIMEVRFIFLTVILVFQLSKVLKTKVKMK